MNSSLAVAQVTPYPWEARREVNEYVEQLSAALAARGHAMLVLAPSGSRSLVRDSRRAIRAAASDPESLLTPGAVTVLAMGQSVPAPARRGGTVSVPIDVAKTIERVLMLAPLDIVHVHEPFAPSASAAALRHSRRSTSAPSIHPRSGCSRRRSRGASSSCSSAGSTLGWRPRSRRAS